jgi:hypothetical protein
VQASLDLETYTENALINEIRSYVDRWRSLRNPADWGVTAVSQRLLEHWPTFSTPSSPRPAPTLAFSRANSEPLKMGIFVLASNARCAKLSQSPAPRRRRIAEGEV